MLAPYLEGEERGFFSLPKNLLIVKCFRGASGGVWRRKKKVFGFGSQFSHLVEML